MSDLYAMHRMAVDADEKRDGEMAALRAKVDLLLELLRDILENADDIGYWEYRIRAALEEGK